MIAVSYDCLKISRASYFHQCEFQNEPSGPHCILCILGKSWSIAYCMTKFFFKQNVRGNISDPIKILSFKVFLFMTTEILIRIHWIHFFNNAQMSQIFFAGWTEASKIWRLEFNEPFRLIYQQGQFITIVLLRANLLSS